MKFPRTLQMSEQKELNIHQPYFAIYFRKKHTDVKIIRDPQPPFIHTCVFHLDSLKFIIVYKFILKLLKPPYLNI